MKRFHKTEGVIINRFPLKDFDWLLTIFTPNYGKIITFAKSSRKITSSRAAKLTLFTRIKFEFIDSKAKKILTHVDIISSHKESKKQLYNISRLFEMGELLNELLPEDQPHPSIYRLFLKALTHLPRFTTPQYMYRFKLKLLQELGYGGQDLSPSDLDHYLESILEHPLRTPHIFSDPTRVRPLI